MTIWVADPIIGTAIELYRPDVYPVSAYVSDLSDSCQIYEVIRFFIIAGITAAALVGVCVVFCLVQVHRRSHLRLQS